MTRVITPPPVPRAVPPLVVEPGELRTMAADLLAASAQVDDLGSHLGHVEHGHGVGIDVVPVFATL